MGDKVEGDVGRHRNIGYGEMGALVIMPRALSSCPFNSSGCYSVDNIPSLQLSSLFVT